MRIRRVIYSEPFAFASWFSDRLAAVGCSPLYIDAWWTDFFQAIESGEITVKPRQ